MEYKDKDGKIIDLAGVDEKTIGVVGRIVEGQIAAMQTAVQETVATAVGKVVSEQIKPLADKVAAAKPAEKDAGGAGGGGEQSELLKALNALTEQVTSLKTEREGERKAQTSRSIAEAVVGKERPNLRGKNRLVDRIASAGVSTEDEAKKVIAEWEAEMKDMLGEEGFKGLSADPTGEGAKDQPKGSEAEKAAAKERLLKEIKAPAAA